MKPTSLEPWGDLMSCRPGRLRHDRTSRRRRRGVGSSSPRPLLPGCEQSFPGRVRARRAPGRGRRAVGTHAHGLPRRGLLGAGGAVCVRQDPAGTISGQVHGTADREAVRRQVERILSLDVDGTGFQEVGRRDRVVGGLQARYPGLRPVCFWSPYEAAAWALISHRIRITQAAGIKARMAERLGVAVGMHGQRLHAFPQPERLAQLDGFLGLHGRKVGYLRELAVATLEGVLDAARLRGLSRDQALVELCALPGIGPFSAGLILLRRRCPGCRSGSGAPAGTRGGACLRTRIGTLNRGTARDRRGLASVPDLGRVLAACPARGRDRRDRRPPRRLTRPR